MTVDYSALYHNAGSVFTPGSPVSEKDLFAGRHEQIKRLMEAVSQRGFHAVLYGDRGVGKTSLASVLSSFLHEVGSSVMFVKTNCDSTDDFTSLWQKVLKEITFREIKTGFGFMAQEEISVRSVIDTLPNPLTPDDVRRTLNFIGSQITLVIALDEFDRLENREAASLVSDTIKSLSDSANPATIILIGVADSVDLLIEGHKSIERSLVQVAMPRMSAAETREIVEKGAERLNMRVEPEAFEEIINLSQGLPYVTHMLSLYSVRAALEEQDLSLGKNHVMEGIKKAIEQWQESIKTAYYEATSSHQPGHLYREVLLSCALANVDDKNFFTAAAVRDPLKHVAGKNLDIPNFARHLKEFSEDRRGNILSRQGERRRIKYRFVSPLMRPYVIMRSVADGILTDEMRDKIQSK